MDHPWTSPSSRPLKLYRIIHPNSSTNYNPSTGFTAGAPRHHIPVTQLRSFLESITCHRDQEPFLSPYISTFSSLQEAEMWAIAAEDVFKQECYVVEINVTHAEMRDTVMWYVQDIQDCTKRPLGKGSVEYGGKRDSEWLILHAVPGVAMKVLKGSKAIRKDQNWTDDKFDGVHCPEELNADMERVDYNKNFYNIVDFMEWEKCPCPNPRACQHAGPWGLPWNGCEEVR